MFDRKHKSAGGRPPAARAEARSRAAPESDWAERSDLPVYRVVLWPHRSLSPRARRWVMVLVALGLTAPVVPYIATPIFWGLLPFEGAAFFALWLSFRRNDADARLSEMLSIWPDEIRVERHEPSGRVLRWRADPYWVRVLIHVGGRPENYLTLKGGGREIELGAFLSPEERTRLAGDVEQAIQKALRSAP